MFVHRCIRDTPIAPFKYYFDLRGNAHDENFRNNEDLAPNQIPANMGAHSTHIVDAKLGKIPPTLLQI